MLMAAAISSLAVPTTASAQKYYMRAKISGLGAAAAATPPIEYKGMWRNTGELSPGLCENGSRRVDWVYECRVDGNVSYSGDGCDPAKKPNTLSHMQSCSSVCGDLSTAGYVSGDGPGSSQTVSGTLAEMKASAKLFCESYPVRPDLARYCGLRKDADGSGQWRMYVTSGIPPLAMGTSPNAVYATCQAVQ
jgi:hypothetical protein